MNHKIRRKCSDIAITVDMLIHSDKIPEISEAMVFLQNLSPDIGKSCWFANGFKYGERTVTVSVIVPAYNVEKYITGCLESILQQKTSFNYEVIVINDGSTDTTSKLLERYSSNEKVTILHQQNRGLSAARNIGIDFSKGEYLCFVDSDDELLEGALECLVKKAAHEQAMIVAASVEKCFRDGRDQYTMLFRDEKSGLNGLTGFAHGKVIHYSVFNNLRFPEGYWYEDSVMAQIVHPLCANDIYTVSNICYKYFSNEAGITAISKGNKKSLDSLWITKRLLNERKLFGLSYDQNSYEYFISMVNLTYQRTKYMGVHTAKCIFVVQKMLLEKYYKDYNIVSNNKKKRIQKALKSNSFRKYILALSF